MKGFVVTHTVSNKDDHQHDTLIAFRRIRRVNNIGAFRFYYTDGYLAVVTRLDVLNRY